MSITRIDITSKVLSFKRSGVSVNELEQIIEAWIYFNTTIEEAIEDSFEIGIPFYSVNLLDYRDFKSFLESYDLDEKIEERIYRFLTRENIIYNKEDVYSISIEEERIKSKYPEDDVYIYILSITNKGDLYGLRYSQLLLMRNKKRGGTL